VKTITVTALTGFLTLGSFLVPAPFTHPVLAEETADSAVDTETEAPVEPLTNVQRFAGNTRYETAVEISNKNWVDAGSVVLARGDDFPDALAGAVLAKSSAVNGPLLLNDPGKLRSEVLAELKNLRTSKVYVLGGKGAISETVVQELNSNGISVTRVDGANRYDTAAKIAKTAMSSSTKAYLVSGSNYADALSISSYAAASNIPLLLTAKDLYLLRLSVFYLISM
jgi:putative cell wall-binding protein